ncbi:MAG: 4-hydroxy-tetrahydrodipicolinate reductase [bacterium]
MIRVALFGAAGRMGSSVLSALEREPDIDVLHAIDKPGTDAREVMGIPIVPDDTSESFESDVWVDVSLPDAAYRHALRAEELGRPILIGTTGFSKEQAQRLDRLSCAHIIAPNLSLGVNLLLEELPRIRRILGKEYDVGIVDTHHKHKVDAPSGTAKKIAEQLEREGGSVQVVSLRIGEVVGEHRILFAVDGEQIEIIHRAESRMAFAHGVAPAVRFLHGKRSGGYSMKDVLGL